jgi:hypothetical protein
MKKGKKITIKINLTNKWLYTFIAIGIIAIIGVGVYAIAPGVVPDPGHNINDLSVPSSCAAGQFLQYNGANWVCASETDPNVPAWAKQPTNQPIAGAFMGGYIVQYIWGPGQSYGGHMDDGAINVNGAGLGFISSRCGGNYGVASGCTCPSGYSRHFIPGGTGTLQGEFTGSGSCGGQASCVITNFAVFCIKQ